MNWYQIFNIVEAMLWWIVAAVIATRASSRTQQQRAGILLGTFSFLLFGVTDLLEAAHERQIPLWLWGMKILCGIGILSARYTWLGWSHFHWRQREFLFGVGCLLAVLFIIFLQFEWKIGRP